MEINACDRCGSRPHVETVTDREDPNDPESEIVSKTRIVCKTCGNSTVQGPHETRDATFADWNAANPRKEQSHG